MKYIILLGSMLLSCSLFAMEKSSSEIVLHFNDRQEQTLSADLAQYIPNIKDSIDIPNAIQETLKIDFSLISSSDWHLIAPFLPAVKQIAIAKDEIRHHAWGLPLDLEYKDDSIAQLFLQMQQTSEIKHLLQILHTAHFLQISILQDVAKISVIEALKKKENFESFVKKQGEEYYTLSTDLQEQLINTLYYKKLKDPIFKITGSIAKEYHDKYFKLIYNSDQSTLLFIKPKWVERPRFQSIGVIRLKTPKLNVSQLYSQNYSFLHHLLFMQLKAEWKLTEKQDLRGNYYAGSGDFDTPRNKVQLYKHTYPHSIYLYDTLKSHDAIFLKTITQIGNCVKCQHWYFFDLLWHHSRGNPLSNK